MTILELKKKYSDDRNELRTRQIEALIARLKEINLDGLVKRVKDGKIGWLYVTYDCRVEFHPRTKSGEMSKNANGWEYDIEESYEPYKEAEE